jgi:hypothetical protein
MNEHELVRVHLRVRMDDGSSQAEVLRASVNEGSAVSTYRLQNHAFFAPLAAGDVVRAEPDGSGVLQVVDIVRPMDAVLTLVGRVWDADVDLDAVMDRWQAGGAGWTEGVAGAVATVWAEGMSPEAVVEVMNPELEAGALELLEVSLPGDRTRQALADQIDFSLAGDVDG